MLPNTLVTHEVKDQNGADVNMTRLSTTGRSTEFALSAENPHLPYRLSIKHQESGTGITRRRRSVVRIDQTVATAVDATKTCNIAAYCVLDIPLGALGTMAETTNTLANLISFLASTGASTTILYNGTGNGAAALLSGGL